MVWPFGKKQKPPAGEPLTVTADKLIPPQEDTTAVLLGLNWQSDGHDAYSVYIANPTVVQKEALHIGMQKHALIDNGEGKYTLPDTGDNNLFDMVHEGWVRKIMSSQNEKPGGLAP